MSPQLSLIGLFSLRIHHHEIKQHIIRLLQNGKGGLVSQLVINVNMTSTDSFEHSNNYT